MYSRNNHQIVGSPGCFANTERWPSFTGATAVALLPPAPLRQLPQDSGAHVHVRTVLTGRTLAAPRTHRAGRAGRDALSLLFTYSTRSTRSVRAISCTRTPCWPVQQPDWPSKTRSGSWLSSATATRSNSSTDRCRPQRGAASRGHATVAHCQITGVHRHACSNSPSWPSRSRWRAYVSAVTRTRQRCQLSENTGPPLHANCMPPQHAVPPLSCQPQCDDPIPSA